MNIRGGALDAKALRVLEGIPGLTVGIERGRGTDAYIRIHGRRTPILVEFRMAVNAAGAWQLVDYAGRHHRKRVLIVADQTTVEARQILQRHDIAFVDGLGNAHLELPGLLLHLEGKRRPAPVRGTIRPARLQGKAGLIAQALLGCPEREWQVSGLVEEARVSVGLAHRVLTRLEAEGILEAEGTGPRRVRRVIRPAALLDLWAEEDAVRATETLAHRLAQTPQQLLSELGRSLGRRGIEYAITATAAASLVAPFVTAVPIIEVWAQSAATDRQLCDAAGADRVAEGHNIVFLQAKDDAPLAFSEQRDGLCIANRFRIYSDLRHDPRRGREQADHLRRELIGF